MKTVLITGATDGIGKETALALSRLGHEVILHGRSPDKTEKTRAEILKMFPNARLHTTFADFADLGAIAVMAKDIISRFPKLELLGGF